jgi:hypothetical protein
MRGQFTLEYWQDGEWVVGRLLEVPGVFSQGATLEELRENIQEPTTSWSPRSGRRPRPHPGGSRWNWRYEAAGVHPRIGGSRVCVRVG